MSTLADLQKTIGGMRIPRTERELRPDEVPVGRCVHDSRQVEPGDVFWAMPGESRNGADFAEEAFRRGAAGIVADRVVAVPSGCWGLVVRDPLGALVAWAAHRRWQFSGAMIAVTGSVGKTTTREMIHAVLSQKFTGTASPRNYNNHVGLPLSLLRIDPEDDYAVLELGASAPGEIARLAALCKPTIGVITTIGEAHLTGFGGRQEIAKAKGELLAALPADGYAVFSKNEQVSRIARHYGVPHDVVGRTAGCSVTASDVRSEGGTLRFRVEQQPFEMSVWGRHYLDSALTAVAVGRAMGLDLATVAQGLATFQPVAMRCEVFETDEFHVINDAYNASPTSMRAALEVLRDFPVPGRRVVVCGDMAELGDEAEIYHRQLGDQVVTVCGADALVACGSMADSVARGALDSGMPRASVTAFPSVDEACQRVSELLTRDDVVLVKGSRCMEMERIVETIARHQPEHKSRANTA